MSDDLEQIQIRALMFQRQALLLALKGLLTAYGTLAERHFSRTSVEEDAAEMRAHAVIAEIEGAGQ